MHLHHIVNQADLERGIADKLITVRESGDGQLIYNYSDAALFTAGAWDNPAVRACRGLIVDAETLEVVARPWEKFFNHGQKEAGYLDLDERVEVTDKMDGSLGIIHLAPNGSPRVATRGSFHSEQARHATARLDGYYFDSGVSEWYTLLVEIVYPENRIVCDYGDRDELVLLGMVSIQTGLYFGPQLAAKLSDWQGPVTETFPYATLRHALAAAPRPGAEGLCVRFPGQRKIVKIKQEDYVRLHKIVTGLSERSVWQHALDGGDLPSLLSSLPDELHAWTRDVWDRLTLDADLIEWRARDAHNLIVSELPVAWTRRDYAELAKAKAPLTPLLFHLLDGRDPRSAILRGLKPAGDTRAKALSEATA